MTRAMTGRLSALAALAALFLTAAPAGAARDADELVVFKGAGCFYCEQWDENVGSIWRKTEEGEAIALREVLASEPVPADLRDLATRGYTPTFVLLHCGEEVGRIVGYPGENFFWPMLGDLIEDIPDTTC